ncbi:MAG: M20/M25/M40 family metallo-hydrolase [Chloroflexia bacterium]
MDPVYDYIAAHEAEALAELTAYCRRPSVSAEGRAIAEMAEMVRAGLERRGFRAEMVPNETGFPVVYAESLDEAPPDAPTLLIYNHYDVQPEGDSALWSSPPFELTIRDGKALARGAVDTKGNIVSRLAAIDALRATGGLPIKVKWVIEGEEEIGSPNLDPFLLEHRERLVADGCLWEFGTFNWDGTPQIMLGLKGMLTVELSVTGPNRDLHSSMAAYVTSPVWRLVGALASLKDANDRLLIDGFYERVTGLSPTDIALIKQLPDNTQQMLDNLGVDQFASGLRGYDLRVAEVSTPTCNIQGIWAGYQGPGSKTILPREAHAKLDFRLVPNQDPDEVLELLRRHLAEHGFKDVAVTQIEGNLFPARTDPDDPFVALTMRACAELSGKPPLVIPSSPASGPMYSFTHGLGLPVVAVGVGYPGSAAHAPDENIRIEDFRAGTRLIALLMTRMAEMDLAAAPAEK